MRMLLCFCLIQFGVSQDLKQIELQGDYDEYIVRPCRLYDLKCIRNYFATHGKCKKVHGLVPEPLYRAQATSYLPRLNTTVTMVNINYYGLNGEIVEFYINKKTNRLVLAVQMRDVTTDIKTTYFRIQRRAKEPIIRATPMNVTYASLTPTIIIPNLNDLRLDKSEIFTYVEDAAPKFAFDPDVFDSTDPAVIRFNSELLMDIRNNIQEEQFLESNIYIISFIQYSLCDFGLKPS